MKNLIDCLTQRAGFNISLIENFKSLEQHGSKLTFYFDDKVNLADHLAICDDKDTQCCDGVRCTIDKTEGANTLVIENKDENSSLMAALMDKNCCIETDKGKCCDDENWFCC